MTLLSFKSYLKKLGLLSIVLVYSAGLFLLGRSQALDSLLKFRVGSHSAVTPSKQVDLPIPYTDTQTGSVIGSVIKYCANTHFGFEVVYPKDWFTTYNLEPQKCTFFAPFSFVVPQDPSNFSVPIEIEVVISPDWSETLKFYQNPNDFQNVLSFENLEIGGREVQRIKTTSTGKDTLSRGLLKVSYLFFDDENPLVLTYQQLDANENIGDNEKIIDDMAKSLKFI